VEIGDPFIEEKREHIVIKGEIPSLMNRPPGCAFSNRCPLATKECREIEPPLVDKGNGRSLACIKV
jgi:peptide/nickel transport system ATP-binding protein